MPRGCDVIMNIAVEGAVVRPERHDRLWVTSQDRAEVATTRSLRTTASSDRMTFVDRCGETDRPVVGRRRSPGDAVSAVPVGLPLPPRLGEARFELTIASWVPWWCMPSPTLTDVHSVVTPFWRGKVGSVLALGRSLGLVPRVFGSLLCEAMTASPHLRPAPDLDLLWPLRDMVVLDPLLRGLERIKETYLTRVDGEVLTADGGIDRPEPALARRRHACVVPAESMHRAAFVPAIDLIASEVAPCS